MAKDIAQQLIQNRRVVNSHRAYLGIQLASTFGGEGVLVYSVTPGGPAAKAGLPSNVLITSLNGTPTPTISDLTSVPAGLNPGQTVTVAIEHPDGSTSTVDITLGGLPG